MATFTPNGRAHQILRLLQNEPMARHEINRLMADNDRELKRVGFVIRSLKAAGLIRGVQEVQGYEITPDGKTGLMRLGQGEPVHFVDAPPWSGPAVPTVRVFVREARAHG